MKRKIVVIAVAISALAIGPLDVGASGSPPDVQQSSHVVNSSLPPGEIQLDDRVGKRPETPPGSTKPVGDPRGTSGPQPSGPPVHATKPIPNGLATVGMAAAVDRGHKP